MVIVFAIMGGIASWRNGGSCARQHSFTVIPCVEQFPHIAYTLASLFRIITALGTRRGANFGLVLFKDKDVCLEFVARSKETLLSFSLGHSTSVKSRIAVNFFFLQYPTAVSTRWLSTLSVRFNVSEMQVFSMAPLFPPHKTF